MSLQFKQYLNKLRRSDESTKRRWFIGSTIVIMALVIGLWIIYINNITAEPLFFSSNKQKDENSFSETFKRGIDNLSNDLGKRYEVLKKSIDQNIGVIKEQITEPNVINIEGESPEFSTQSLENIPPTPLP